MMLFIFIYVVSLQICVPKVGTFESHDLTEQDCLCHVLIKVSATQYKTASDKVSLCVPIRLDLITGIRLIASFVLEICICKTALGQVLCYCFVL